MARKRQTADLGTALGSHEPAGSQVLTLYIPDRDRAYSYIRPDRFMAELPSLRRFLHDFGRRTNQGEVVVEFDGLFYRIRQFDEG